MDYSDSRLNGFIIIYPDVYEDERGLFLETFQEEKYKKIGINEKFVQDNQSRSVRGVLRGLHYQINSPQSQLLTVMQGKIYDVVVDLRKNSDTFKHWQGIELSDSGTRQIYMAPGFAHGFYVLSETADLHYKVSQFYNLEDEGGILWNDQDLNIDWPDKYPLISTRDASFPRLQDIPITRLPNIP